MPGTTDYLPSKEAELVTWSNTFSALLNALQPAGAYNLTAQQCADFATLNTAWVDAYNLANGNSTRTPSAIVAKDQAKAAMIANARELAQIIQADPTITNQEKSDLGLTVRDSEPTPVPIPETAPVIIIESTTGTEIDIRLRDLDNPDSRAKPAGVFGASVYTAFGTTPPDLSDKAAWTHQGNVTRTLTHINFAGAASGTTAWITAFWFNTRGESGPAAQPISVQIPGQFQMAA